MNGFNEQIFIILPNLEISKNLCVYYFGLIGTIKYQIIRICHHTLEIIIACNT